MKHNILFGVVSLCTILFLTNCEKETPVTTTQDPIDESALDVSSVNNSYIVVLKDDNNSLKSSSLESYETAKENVKTRAEQLLSNRLLKSSTLTQVYAKALKGFVTELTDDELAKLQSDESVLSIEKNKIVYLPTITARRNDGTITTQSQTIPWGITRVGGSISGVGKTAWIIDTGIDLDHPDLNVDTDRAVQFLGSRYTPDDQNGHGTHVAGTVAALDNSIGVIGVAPGATVVPVRVLDRSGSGTLAGVIAGIDYVAAYASEGDVANMSLGGGISTTLDEAVIAASSTVKFALAAGNESDDVINHSPARANGTNIYTVSAMDSNDDWAYFSNYGAGIDYCAPGYYIYSTYKNGTYATLSGTSMATPHVCGLLLITDNITTDGYVSGDPDGDPDPIAHN